MKHETLIRRLAAEHRLSTAEYEALLTGYDREDAALLG